MNSHKNARLTFEGRKLLLERIAADGVMDAARAAGVSLNTACKWRSRFLSGGVQSLMDRSSRPGKTRTIIDAATRDRIQALRHTRMSIRCLALHVECSVATISRLLAGMGLSNLKSLDPKEAVMRYEHDAPGDLLHLDTRN